jgi:FHS family L-fucose permease-like MFS transporter
MAGRFVGTILMTWIAPRALLTVFAMANVALCIAVIAAVPSFSVYALIAMFFFMSIMFPTIFALAIRDLGARTKRAASFLIMSIVGGALIPLLMGWIGDHYGMPRAYAVPAVCFAIVIVYGWKFAVPRASRPA